MATPQYMSAADYAKLPSSIAAEKSAMAYQAGNPQYSSSRPQAWDKNSAAYIPGATQGAGGKITYANIAGVQTAQGANPNASTTAAIFDGSNGTAKGYRTAAGKIVYGDGDATERAEVQKLVGYTMPSALAASATYPGDGGASPVNYPGMNDVKQAPPTAVSSQTMNPATGQAYTGQNLGFGGNGNLPGQYSIKPVGETPVAPSAPNSYTAPTLAPNMPATATSAFATKTPDQIKAEAKARTDALLAKQTTIAGQTKQGFQTSFDRLAATTKDDRTLQDASFQRNNNPFSGGTDYRASMMDRERERTDREGQQDLQSRLANVDLSLADYANATDAQRMQMETDMTNQERSYGLQVDQLALQRQGQDFNQGIAQAGVTGQYKGQNTMQQNQNNFSNGIAYSGLTGYTPDGQRTLAGQGLDSSNRFQEAGLTGQYNGQNTMQQNQNNITNDQWKSTFDQSEKQNQIINNRNIANDTLALRKQHIDEANYYSDKYGITVDPKDDFQLVLDQVAGKQTVAQQSAAGKAQEAQRSEAWKRVENFGSVQSQADADLLGVPVGTQSAKAKEAALDNAYRNRTAGNSEANTAISKATQEFNQSIAKEKQRIDGLDSAVKRDSEISKLFDSSPYVKKTYDEDGKVTGTTVTDKQGLGDSIISMNLPMAEMQKWFNHYGIDYRSLGN